MRFITRNCHNSKRVQSCPEVNLSSHSGGSNNNNLDRDKIANQTIWRRSVGLLPLDALFAKHMNIKSYVPAAHIQDKGTIHRFRRLKWCQSPQLILVDPHLLSTTVSQDIAPYPSPPQMTSTFTTTTCVRDKGRSNGISLNQKQYQEFPDESAGASLSSPIHSKPSPASNGYPFDYSDPCTSIAQLFGVKVRDFAFEAHGAKTARVVTMEDSLKYQYSKYRAAHQAPPEDLINDLSYYEGEWLEEAEKKPDESFVVENSTTDVR